MKAITTSSSPRNVRTPSPSHRTTSIVAGELLLAVLAAGCGGSSGAGASRGASLRVGSCGPIALAPGVLPRPRACIDYAADLLASGGLEPYTFSVSAGALPAGLVLSADGHVVGVATSAGSAASFAVTATDADGCTGSASYVLPVTSAFPAADDQVHLVIPPQGSGGSGDPQLDTTVSTLLVSGNLGTAVAVIDLEVHVSLTHQRVGDLKLTLVAPDGTRIVLADHRGGTGQDGLGTTFSDAAAVDICDGAAPFAGAYRPEEPLGVRPANGIWTLEIEDGAVGSTGELLDWSLEIDTAYAGQTSNFGSERLIWGQSFSADVHDQVSDGNHLYIAAGDSFSRVLLTQPYLPPDWVFTVPGSEARGVARAELSSGALVVIASPSNGVLYSLDPLDGSARWARNLRRPTCSADSLATPVVFQIRSRSDCAFRAAVPSDLLFVGTRHGCSTTTANKIYALDPTDASSFWTFNATGSTQVGAVTGLVGDPCRNRVFAVSAKPDPFSSQHTVWSLDSRTGAKTWSRALGDIQVQPILADGLIVLSSSGGLQKLDPDSGATTWSLTLGGGTRSFVRGMACDPTRRLLFVADSAGELYAVEDQGGSAATLWTLPTISDLREVAVTPARAWVYAAALNGRVYQLDELTGNIDRFQQVGSSSPGAAPGLRVESTIGTGFAEARLMCTRGPLLHRLRIPWFSSDHPGPAGDDVQYLPYARLQTTGGTLPPTALVGELVTDTLTVTDFYNRAPECVVVQATLPPGMSFVGGTVPDGSVSLVGNQITARLGRVELGESVALTVTLRPEVSGTFARTYAVSSELPNPSSSVTLTLVTQVPDTTPPVLECPPGVHVTTRTPGGGVVEFTVTATDETDPAPSVVCLPASGSFFPRGTTNVICTATDAAGNQASCVFPVTVTPTLRERQR